MLSKSPVEKEIVYDRDSRIINLYKVIRDEGGELERLISLTSFSLSVFNRAKEKEEEGLFGAYYFLIQNRMSYMGFNRQFDPRIEQVWRKTAERISPLTARFQSVKFECADIKSKVSRYGKNTFIYLDPPYPLNVRSETSVYRWEMSFTDHQALLKKIKVSLAKIMISSYENSLYNTELKNWEQQVFLKCLLCANGKKKPIKVEKIWKNYDE